MLPPALVRSVRISRAVVDRALYAHASYWQSCSLPDGSVLVAIAIAYSAHCDHISNVAALF